MRQTTEQMIEESRPQKVESKTKHKVEKYLVNWISVIISENFQIINIFKYFNFKYIYIFMELFIDIEKDFNNLPFSIFFNMRFNFLTGADLQLLIADELSAKKK